MNTHDRVRRVLDPALAKADSKEAAEEILEEAERLAAGATEEQKRREKAGTTEPADNIERQARRRRNPTSLVGKGSQRKRAAAVLVETGAQAVAPTQQAEAVTRAAQEAAGTRPGAAPPKTERGRELLQGAVLRRLSPWDRLDAKLFLAVNRPHHPRWLDRLADAMSVVTTGGWIWAAGLLMARRLSPLKYLLPVLGFVNLAVEHPIKSYFRRRRPFVEVVRAVVVGKKPGTWSFPSGHTAASFAAAWCVSRVWPRATPALFGLAGLVGGSRVYVGAHYPGDVVSGAVAGIGLAAVFHSSLRRVLR